MSNFIESDENNENQSGKFQIDDIEIIEKPMNDSFENINQTNKINDYILEDNTNYNYNSNDIPNINPTDKESKNYIIESKDLYSNNTLINYNNNLVKSNYSNKEEVIEEGPITLIEFNHSNFTLNENALNILNTIKEDLIIVSIVGKARTGKSYLMNLLLNNNQSKYPGNGFEMSSRLNSCTRGIWIWNTPRQKPNSSAKILFIDSEGTNSVDLSTKTYDSKIFALIVLISSLFIYNTNGNIDEKSISDLALAAHLSNTVAINAIEDKDIIINELAPKFIWVLRDFVLDKIDPETGEEISSNEYLELCLRNKTTNNINKNFMENNLIRENILKYFKDRECITLPRPVDQERDLQKLNEIPFDGLKPNFREEFLNLKRKIYENSKVKKIENKKVNGPILVGLLKSFISALNSKIIPNINTAMDNIMINEIEKSYDTCIKLWKENFEKIKQQNCNNKDLYDIKYYVMNEYNTVINENKEIKYNIQYSEIFNNNKQKLENEIQSDIQRINTIINNKKNILLNNILNKYKNIKYDNNNLNNNQKEYVINSLFENYSNFINDVKNNCSQFDTENAMDMIIIKDKEYNSNFINDIVNVINKDYDMKKKEIEEKINEDELYMNSFDINQLYQINETLNCRYEVLNEELDLKEKEVFGLIGKYTKLVEEKDKIISNNNNSLFKRGDTNLALKNQKLQNGYCGITVDTTDKGCGCDLGDFCSIF